MTDPYLLLTDDHVRRSPFAAYREFRETHSMCESWPGIWLAGSYSSVSAIMRDPRFGLDRRRAHALQRASAGPAAVASNGPPPALLPYMESVLFFVDPPAHSRLRGFVNRAFSSGVVVTVRDQVERSVTRIFDQIEQRGRMDVMSDLIPVPTEVFCALLCIPEQDYRLISEWMEQLRDAGDIFGERLMVAAMSGKHVVADEHAAQRRHTVDHVLARFAGYFLDLTADQARHGKDTLLARLGSAYAGDQLTETELVGTCITLLLSGHVTTSSFIGCAILALIEHLDQLGKLQQRPELLQNAVEETLRFAGAQLLSLRIALDDVVVDGYRVNKGDLVLLLLGCANRDPRQFERPEMFDIERNIPRHLAFGEGVHFCIGAALPRMIWSEVLAQIARRFSSLRLEADSVHDLPLRDSIALRSFLTLPVRVTRRA